MFVITTQQESDRGRKQHKERWWRCGSNRGGKQLRPVGEETGGRREGGEVQREREAAKVSGFACMCVIVCEYVWV